MQGRKTNLTVHFLLFYNKKKISRLKCFCFLFFFIWIKTCAQLRRSAHVFFYIIKWWYEKNMKSNMKRIWKQTWNVFGEIQEFTTTLPQFTCRQEQLEQNWHSETVLFSKLKVHFNEIWRRRSHGKILQRSFMPYKKKNFRSASTNGKLIEVSLLKSKRSILKRKIHFIHYSILSQ